MRRLHGLLLLSIMATVFTACGAPRPRGAMAPVPTPSQPTAQVFPETAVFEGIGKSPDFASSRRLAHQDVMRKAIVSLVGERSYTSQKTQIDGQFLNTEAQFAPYILDKEWTSTRRDENGMLVLGLKATIATKRLRDDLSAAGFIVSPTPTVPGVSTPPAPQERARETEPEIDLSGVDISGLSILIYYNTHAVRSSRDPDAERNARRAVQLLNQELIRSGIEVFDLESAERIVREKNLLQEEARGNIGMGLLLAGQVHAELYGEVVPTITYRGGTVAHVILDLKLYVRTGGRVIASIQRGGEEFDSLSVEASTMASMRDSARKVAKELLNSLKKYVHGGRFYTVRLIEVGSARDASSFASAVSRLERVRNVKQTLFSRSDRTAEYEIQFQGNPNELMEIIFDGLTARPGFEALDLSTLRGNELIFTMQ